MSCKEKCENFKPSGKPDCYKNKYSCCACRACEHNSDCETRIGKCLYCQHVKTQTTSYPYYPYYPNTSPTYPTITYQSFTSNLHKTIMQLQRAPRDYCSVCSICGCPLRKEDIYASLVGELWHQGMPVSMATPAGLHFCKECFMKVQKYANDSVDRAFIRMRQLEDYF